MINQSTKEKGRWAAARILGTLCRLSKTYGRMDKKTKTCKCYNSYQSIHFLAREEAQVVEAQAALVEVEEWHLRSDKTCSWSQFTGREDLLIMVKIFKPGWKTENLDFC